MASLERLSILVPLALAAALPLPACEHSNGGGPSVIVQAPAREVAVQDRGGPPPHAPAHGYRRKMHVDNGPDLQLVFDSGLGAYVVVGIPDLYFLDGHYFRFASSGWQISVHHDSGWAVAVQSDVPSGLWKSKSANGKKIPQGQAKKAGGPPGPGKHGPWSDD
jgi:hypothetical protein